MTIRKEDIPNSHPRRFAGDDKDGALAQVPEEFRPYAAALYEAMEATGGKGVALLVVNADDSVSFSSFIHPETVEADKQAGLNAFLADAAGGLRAVVTALLEDEGEDPYDDEASH